MICPFRKIIGPKEANCVGKDCVLGIGIAGQCVFVLIEHSLAVLAEPPVTPKVTIPPTPSPKKVVPRKGK